MELADIGSWHWLSLAGLLLIGELLGAAGFLLGLIMAALTLSLLVGMAVLIEWQSQLLWFAMLSVLFSVLYWKLFRRFNRRTDAPNLNNRAAQMIGKRAELPQPLAAGPGRIMIGGSFWRVETEDNLEEGVTVEVIAAQGMVLTIKQVN